MSRVSRQQKAEKNLHALEREFEDLLHEALHSCANGRWGLLGQYPERYRLKESEQLEALGQKIDALRKELGIIEDFWFYARQALQQYPRIERRWRAQAGKAIPRGYRGPSPRAAQQNSP